MWSTGTRVGGVLCDKVSRFLNALLNSGLILTHGNREAAIICAGKCVAHHALDGSNQALDLVLVLLQHIEQLFGALP